MKLTRAQALRFCRILKSSRKTTMAYELITSSDVDFPWCLFDTLLEDSERKLWKRDIERGKTGIARTKELAEFFRQLAEHIDDYVDDVQEAFRTVKEVCDEVSDRECVEPGDGEASN